MLPGQQLQHVHQPQHVPAHRAAPSMGSTARFRVRPHLRPGFIPRMVVQPSPGLIGVFVGEGQLLRRITDTFLIAGHQAVLHIEGRRHMQPIQPHLIGIALLVPEATVRSAGLMTQLFPEDVRCSAVLFLPSRLVQVKQLAAITDIVQVKAVEGVIADTARIIGNESIHRILDVVEVLLFAGQGVKGLHAAPCDAVVITPAAGQQAVALHQAVSHSCSRLRHEFLQHAYSSSSSRASFARRTAPV